MSEALLIVFGVAIASVLFFAQNAFYKSKIAPLQTKIKDLEDFYNTLNTSFGASMKHYEDRLKDLKATPNKAIEVNDTMVLLNRQHEFLHSEFSRLRTDMHTVTKELEETCWEEFKENHERIRKMETKVSELAPIHIHWHKEAVQNKLKMKEKFYDPRSSG